MNNGLRITIYNKFRSTPYLFLLLGDLRMSGRYKHQYTVLRRKELLYTGVLAWLQAPFVILLLMLMLPVKASKAV